MVSNLSPTAIIGGLVGENQSKREQADLVCPASAFASSHQLGFKDKAAWVSAEQGILSFPTSRHSGRGKGMSVLESIRLGTGRY